MPTLLTLVGTGLLSYCVYLISGLGVAIMAAAGILLLMLTIFLWFWETRKNALTLADIQSNQHYEAMRILYKISNTL